MVKDALTGREVQPLVANLRRHLAQLVAKKDIKGVSRLERQARAVQELVRNEGLSLVQQNQVAEARLEVIAEGGALLKQLVKRGRPKGSSMEPFRLGDTGLAKTTAHRWQEVAGIGERKRNAYIKKCQEEREEVTVAGLHRYGSIHVSKNAGENEWYTPPEYIAAARRTFGGTIDLDPASSKIANKVVKATKFYTAENDGLTKKWAGKVWMNPPYAQPLVQEFCTKLLEEYCAERVEAAIVLVNNATETEWGQHYLAMAKAACFPAGRVRFLDPDGKPGAPLQGQMVCYFGKHYGSFERNFGDFGAVLRGRVS